MVPAGPHEGGYPDAQCKPALHVAQGAGGLDPGQYRLVAQFPRRMFVPASDDQLTLGGAGLTGPQEDLLVEPV